MIVDDDTSDSDDMPAVLFLLEQIISHKRGRLAHLSQPHQVTVHSLFVRHIKMVKFSRAVGEQEKLKSG